ncbi:acyl-CoA N-acyltransferase [Hypoxylon sp. NC1633]|nr:acyl-CoA N-acyltransferase [Hypoxylon sp. NC1633]
MATIRLRTDQDIAACLQVLDAVYEESGYPVGGVGDPALFFARDDVAWVAEIDGIVTGHISLAIAGTDNVAVALWRRQHPDDTNIAVLGRLFVHPSSRKAGMASTLIDAAVQEARKRRRRLLMFALVKDQDAIRLYCKLGWQHFGSTIYKWGEGNEMAAECFAGPEP